MRVSCCGRLTSWSTHVRHPHRRRQSGKPEADRLLVGRAGYSYEVAENGAEALTRLDHGDFKLVLMDMMMPVMNGYDATKAIRANPKTRNLPVIALTANAMKGEDEKCRAAGCTDYLAKPYSKDQILNAIQMLIRRQDPLDPKQLG